MSKETRLQCRASTPCIESFNLRLYGVESESRLKSRPVRGAVHPVIYFMFFVVTMLVLDGIEGFVDQVLGYVIPERVMNGALFVGVVGAVPGYGVITGRQLACLLRQRVKEELSLSKPSPDHWLERPRPQVM